MTEALALFFDDDTEERLLRLRGRLSDAGVPTDERRPNLVLAAAGNIPTAARTALRSELRLLSVPDLWLHTLGTLPGEDRALLLGAVVDAELLAVHSAVHDVLAGKVRNPSAYHFPGAWIPRCSLAEGLSEDQLTAGFRALLPPDPVRAAVAEVGVLDTRSGELEMLR